MATDLNCFSMFVLPVVSKVTGEEVEQHVAFEELFKEEFSEDEEEGVSFEEEDDDGREAAKANTAKRRMNHFDSILG